MLAVCIYLVFVSYCWRGYAEGGRIKRQDKGERLCSATNEMVSKRNYIQDTSSAPCVIVMEVDRAAVKTVGYEVM